MYRERAVSPVIGVVLMVSITVLLAAVVGVFVVPLAESTSSPPTAEFEMIEDSTSGTITIIHQNGDSVDPNKIEVIAPNGSVTTQSVTTGSNSKLEAGESIKLSASGLDQGDKIRVQWSNGGKSTLLLEDTLNDQGW